MDKISNEQLVELAGTTVIGTPSGLKAQQAQAELDKRLIENMESLKNSLDQNNIVASKYNKILLGLTMLMALLAVFQVLLTTIAMNFSWIVKLVFMVIPVAIVALVSRDKMFNNL